MDETVLLSIAAIIGTLAGVCVGYWLEQSAESRGRFRDACERALAAAYEVAGSMEAIEKARLRDEEPTGVRDQLAGDWFLAIARIRTASPRGSKAIGALTRSIEAAVTAQYSETAKERQAARDAYAQALTDFEKWIRAELGHRWRRRSQA